MSFKNIVLPPVRIASSYVSSQDKLYVDLAVDILQAQNKTLVHALKNFFSALPSPQYVEAVLKAAIYQLAEADPKACRWILQNSDYLEPELYMVELAMQLAWEKLKNQGFVPGKDFKVDLDGEFYITEQAKAELLLGNSPAINLILKEILQTHSE